MDAVHASHVPTPFAELSAIWRGCVVQAWEGFRAGSLPIGAIVADGEGRILAAGRNRLAEPHDSAPHLPGTPYLTGSSLAHAEVNALLALGRTSVTDLRLFTTTEPCPLCMGAARMASITHLVYASRDPWAGCASMAHDVPYLARRGPTAEGPVAGLEDVLVAWQIVRHASWYGETPGFMPIWQQEMPRGYAAGMALFQDGRLQRLADQHADASTAWAIAAEVLAAD